MYTKIFSPILIGLCTNYGIAQVFILKERPLSVALLVISFTGSTSNVVSGTLSPTQCQEILLLCFSDKHFVVLVFTFRSLIHSELIFICGVR